MGSVNPSTKMRADQIPRVAPFLLLLVTMENLNVMLTRHTRNAHQEDLYIIRHFVLITEAGKLVLAVLLEYVTIKGNLLRSVAHHNFQSLDGVKVFIPAALYFVQNSLFYVALSNLSPATFQISYQTKILITAVFSVILLKRSYSPIQWISLLGVTLGVAVVAVSSQADDASSTKAKTLQNASLGTVAVVTSSTCSALAGVIFEKYLKQKPNKTVRNVDETNSLDATTSATSRTEPEYLISPSLYMRNIQMATFSLILAVGSQIFVKQQGRVDQFSPVGYFHGFTTAVWALVLLRAGTGILVAAILKMVDNVVKNMASACSLVVSIILSCVFFETVITANFLVGSTMVILACQSFHSESKYRQSHPSQSRQETTELSSQYSGTRHEEEPHISKDIL